MNRTMSEFSVHGPSVLSDFEKARSNVMELVREHVKFITRSDSKLGPMGEILKHQFQNGSTEKQLEDQVVTFLMAGHETTAASLTWTLWLLTQNKAWLDRVRNESGLPLQDRKQTRLVIEESLRLYPPAWILSRTTKGDFEIPGLSVPGGWLLVMSSYITHRNEGYWDDVTVFNPERFVGKSDRPAYAYWPFGGGRRHCIGKHFALIEMTIVLPELLNNFNVSYLGAGDIKPHAMVTLRPNDGLPVIFNRRN